MPPHASNVLGTEICSPQKTDSASTHVFSLFFQCQGVSKSSHTVNRLVKTLWCMNNIHTCPKYIQRSVSAMRDISLFSLPASEHTTTYRPLSSTLGSNTFVMRVMIGTCTFFYFFARTSATGLLCAPSLISPSTSKYLFAALTSQVWQGKALSTLGMWWFKSNYQTPYVTIKGRRTLPWRPPLSFFLFPECDLNHQCLPLSVKRRYWFVSDCLISNVLSSVADSTNQSKCMTEEVNIGDMFVISYWLIVEIGDLKTHDYWHCFAPLKDDLDYTQTTPEP